MSGELSVSSVSRADGLLFRIHNESAATATGVRWGIDSADNGGIDSLECTGTMLTEADIRPYGSQGTVDLGPGETAECDLRWLHSVPMAERHAMLLAWPGAEYLDQNPMDNVSLSDSQDVFSSGFE